MSSGSSRARSGFATLAGHLEAGQIEFRARGRDGGRRAFEIESWARSGDRLSNLLYHHLRMAKEVQLHMWTETCLGVARNSGGRLEGGVRYTPGGSTTPCRRLRRARHRPGKD